ncbi:hypothetical protein [Christiangramia echinicola]|uniref:Uncharacterized protein n=1 Tax=Christiangramia echinicola TaxID=279359 RepID=A0A1H1KUP9_9FLAO|nr:hypothetical protein [Christiangramia echinicola]SDR65867.1 hypothetical protein SAMN04488552_0205 [Christiangramia echinicola]
MIKQNPFSVYDFLGYFIPGALVIYVFLIISNSNEFESISSVFTVIGNNKSLEIDNLLFFIILSYGLGHLINFLSSITIERYSYWKYDYPSKYLMNLNPYNNYWKGPLKIKIWKSLLFLILLPISILDYLLGEFLNFKDFYTKRLDQFMIEMIKSKGVILLDKLGAPLTNSLRNYDFHRIFSHYVYENSKNHQAKMTNYVSLYGFLRSLSLISVIFFWYSLYKLIVIYSQGITFNEFYDEWKYLIYSFILLGGISYVFFMAFMKFYRRYTLEALMLIVIDPDLKNDILPKTILEE